MFIGTLICYILLLIIGFIIPVILFINHYRNKNFKDDHYTYEDELLELPEEMRK